MLKPHNCPQDQRTPAWRAVESIKVLLMLAQPQLLAASAHDGRATIVFAGNTVSQISCVALRQRTACAWPNRWSRQSIM